MEKTSGIYKIINKTNGKYYVGSSVSIIRRWYNHKTDLEKNNHNNKHLQNAWNKYGKSNFDWIIIEQIPKDKRFIVEQLYLDIAKTEQDKCYNQSFIAGRIEMTDDTRKKMSESRMGEKNPNFGKRMSDEMKHKIRERNKLWKPSDEQKRRISKSMTGSKNHFFGKHHTEETKRKMSIAKK